MACVFSEDEKKVLVEEVEKLIVDWTYYLVEEKEEETRVSRLLPLIKLKDIFESGTIDRIDLSDYELRTLSARVSGVNSLLKLLIL